MKKMFTKDGSLRKICNGVIIYDDSQIKEPCELRVNQEYNLWEFSNGIKKRLYRFTLLGFQGNDLIVSVTPNCDRTFPNLLSYPDVIPFPRKKRYITKPIYFLPAPKR